MQQRAFKEGAGLLAPFVLLLLGFAVWKLWAPAMAWVPSFTTLLDRPVKKTGFLPFITGLETAGGDFEGRPVLLAMHHKRGRHSLGYLVIAMQPGQGSIREQGGLGRPRAPEARTALDQLEADEGLHVSLDGGWLKARWQPVGFMIFPGHFDHDRWHRVLRAMSVVASSLEAERA